MTLRELIELSDRAPLIVIAVFVVLPLIAWLCGRLNKNPGEITTGWRYVYSVLVYLVCVPGMFAAVLVGYTLFFVRANLLDVSLTVYVLPQVSMLATLLIIRQRVSFEIIPGFDRLWALLVLLGTAFAIALAIQKANIWVFFGGSLQQLALIALGVFLLGRWATRSLFAARRTGQ